MKIRNLTPHPVNLFVGNEWVVLPPDGPAPRVATIEVPINEDLPFVGVKVEYGDIQDLPPQEDGVALIVSLLCCQAAPERPDLWYPTRLVRDEQGHVVGCGALARI